ncbi:hypothetical protein TRFO_43282 [Tritrichomonas foetus]|uniref:Major facilitator superfamily transporter n=1 Tax=Tritrichomonas foetus TaxID=1144522 RepID=A0A1J4KVE9_9EUKA|nr:hypothetical protein TRFO_43282 [Tritrichomonas foetus]|eukprot:OHT13708.1 hypothetical protein TRFO_43282 [Tritrichomonas foetus]
MAFSEIFKSKDRRMISMVLLDQVYGIIMSLFWPCVPSFFIGLKISMARITGMNQLVLPIGAMIVSAFCYRFSSNIILSFFFLFGSFVVALISYYYNNKFLVYLLIISYAACEGAYSSLIMGLRKEIYPSSLRGHIMGINRLLQSIYASILIQYTQSLPPDIQPLVTSFVLFVCFILVIFIHHFQQKSDADKQLAGKNEEIKKEENNISKQVTKKKLE